MLSPNEMRRVFIVGISVFTGCTLGAAAMACAIPIPFHFVLIGYLASLVVGGTMIYFIVTRKQ